MFKKAFLFFIAACAFGKTSFSQTAQPLQPPDTGKIVIIQDPRVETLVNKKIEINKKTDGKVSGYRVQIHFGSERDKAKEIKSQFMAKYPNVPAYEIYQQPNFKIRGGDFKTKLEAHKFLKQVQVDFPGAFIVEDKVEMMKLE